MIPEQKNMVINPEYIVAHANNVELTSGQEYKRQLREERKHEQQDLIIFRNNVWQIEENMRLKNLVMVQSSSEKTNSTKEAHYELIAEKMKDDPDLSTVYDQGLPQYRELIFL